MVRSEMRGRDSNLAASICGTAAPGFHPGYEVIYVIYAGNVIYAGEVI